MYNFDTLNLKKMPHLTQSNEAVFINNKKVVLKDSIPYKDNAIYRIGLNK